VVVELGGRIRRARERVGLNQRQLAALTGISQPTISRVEGGERSTLAVTELHRIAMATGTTVTALTREPDQADRILTAARVAAAGDPGAVSAAASAAAELLELDAVLDALSLPGRQQRREVAIAYERRGGPAGQGRSLAAEVRRACQLGHGPLFDVDDLIGQLTGVDVAHRDLGGVSGFCAVDPDRGTAIVLIGTGLNETAERQWFTAAHELAHLLFLGDPKHRAPAGPVRPPQELRADEFARHLLIPLDGVSSWLRANGVDEVTEAELAALANTFRVSPQVALIQLRNLGRAPASVGESTLPTGRQLAYRHGWGAAYDLAQSVARMERPPVRIVDRATQAYRLGKLGLAPLARLLGQSLREAKASLAEAGVVPVQRTTDDTVVAALSGHLMAGLTPDNQAQAMARQIVDADLTAEQVVERLRADLPASV
jgi:Zn-dependent peptidase ImmA (M78 family)/transcriptional regulator with XRE-family HTH domain